MAELNHYWAEEALGEPYKPQDYTWLKSTHRIGLALGGITSALTVTALFGAATCQFTDRSLRVAIASYEFTGVQEGSASSSAPKPTPAPGLTATLAAQPAIAGAAPPATRAPAAKQPPEVSKTRAQHLAAQESVPNWERPKPQAKPTVSIPIPAPPAARARAITSTTPLKAALAKLEDPRPPPKAEQDIRIGLSKGGESKPTDIASGEKLGIREILPDGIVMQNGRKIKNGTALPNGEILVGTDAGKGMAETDRRVLVITP